MSSRMVDCQYWLGDTVFRKMDSTEKLPGMVTSVDFRPNGVIYGVSWRGGYHTDHYEIELTKESCFSVE